MAQRFSGKKPNGSCRACYAANMNLQPTVAQPYADSAVYVESAAESVVSGHSVRQFSVIGAWTEQKETHSGGRFTA